MNEKKIEEPREVMIINNPESTIALATNTSDVLSRVIKDKGWSVNIQGKQYPQVEAWQTVGKFFGYSAKTEWTKYVEYGNVKGFEARVVIVDKDGKEVGGAETSCMNDEKTWATRPLHTLKSMAQTRAVSKAYRQILSWVMVMAGYQPTPYEEVQDLVNTNQTPQPKTNDSEFETIHCDKHNCDVVAKISAKNNKPYYRCFGDGGHFINPPKPVYADDKEPFINDQKDISNEEPPF